MDERTVPLPSGRDATIVVVADTHAKIDARFFALADALAPDVILHGGDIGDDAVLDALAALTPALHAVRGNIDQASQRFARDVPDALALSFTRDGAEVLRALLTHIAVAGPRVTRAAKALAAEARAELVVCGHSHVPFVTRDGALALFNPGSIGPRRFGLPIVFGVMTVGARVTFRHVDVETGDPWVPPAPTGGARATRGGGPARDGDYDPARARTARRSIKG